MRYIFRRFLFLFHGIHGNESNFVTNSNFDRASKYISRSNISKSWNKSDLLFFFSFFCKSKKRERRIIISSFELFSFFLFFFLVAFFVTVVSVVDSQSQNSSSNSLSSPRSSYSESEMRVEKRHAKGRLLDARMNELTIFLIKNTERTVRRE